MGRRRAPLAPYFVVWAANCAVRRNPPRPGRRPGYSDHIHQHIKQHINAAAAHQQARRQRQGEKKMNIAKNMESVFVAVAVVLGLASYTTTDVPVRAAMPAAQFVGAAAPAKMQVVSAPRLAVVRQAKSLG
jgi:hypothetical protein